MALSSLCSLCLDWVGFRCLLVQWNRRIVYLCLPIQRVLSPMNRDKQNIEFTATTGWYVHLIFSEEWRWLPQPLTGGGMPPTQTLREYMCTEFWYCPFAVYILAPRNKFPETIFDDNVAECPCHPVPFQLIMIFFSGRHKIMWQGTSCWYLTRATHCQRSCGWSWLSRLSQNDFFPLHLVELGDAKNRSQPWHKWWAQRRSRISIRAISLNTELKTYRTLSIVLWRPREPKPAEKGARREHNARIENKTECNSSYCCPRAAQKPGGETAAALQHWRNTQGIGRPASQN